MIQLRHPEVLAELRRELDEAIPLDTVIPSIESVKLPYLNAVIKETLRYNGPGFGTFRHCSKDTTLQGVTLPANTTLALWNPQGGLSLLHSTVAPALWSVYELLTRPANSAPRPQLVGRRRRRIQPEQVVGPQVASHPRLLLSFLVRAPQLSRWVFRSFVPSCFSCPVIFLQLVC